MNKAGETAPETEESKAVAAPRNPMRRIIGGVLLMLVALFAYHVLADRYTPYASQARVEGFMTQVASEVSGDVLEVGVTDNSNVRKGELLFRVDPEPYEIAVRTAEANLAVALQAADVSLADVSSARAQLQKHRRATPRSGRPPASAPTACGRCGPGSSSSR